MRIGAFKLPLFTKENSEYVCGNPVIGGVQSLTVTKSAEKDPAVKEAAIDFLQFMFSKEQYKIFVDSTKQIPTVKELDVDPIFEAFQGGSVPVDNILCLVPTKWHRPRQMQLCSCFRDKTLIMPIWKRSLMKIIKCGLKNMSLTESSQKKIIMDLTN